eukprot:CAMPEP_0172307746 /NCGR_PEP_ID=MMETSP1058-20130122/8531_1 /TAXON_ID=83371 /ORGANISM="Detonula confervacea, Strain CCMP 353" /LENGTH=526 /DNA_ID=CAMNT_0013019995 /DNA_START=27 /DNA_END=1607 /DNA_ORIENTATION=+
MSDDEGEERQVTVSVLDAIEIAQDLLSKLKSDVIAAGDDKVVVAGLIETGGGETGNAMNWLRNRSQETAEEISDELFAFLENYSTWPRAMFWSHFHLKLKRLEKTNERFRLGCLCQPTDMRIGGTDSKLIHEVCKLNPPANVVKAILDITPVREGVTFRYRFNALACDRLNENPLHKVVRGGGSIELVKLLVNADVKRKTLKRYDKDAASSVFHVLAANKAKHQPRVFSQILRHLVLTVNNNRSPLLYETKADKKTPVARLWQSLRKEGLSHADILQDDDFIFLLKATLYHFVSMIKGILKHTPEEKISDDYHTKLAEIEKIPLFRAFLVCSSCFSREVIATVLKILFSTDGTFLLTKDKNGKYPIHCIVEEIHWYFIDTVKNNQYGSGFKQFIIEQILSIAPQCAQQTDEKGLLPLHIAADALRLEHSHKKERLSLVRTIWQAYPDAASHIDKETRLPVFALPVRDKDDGTRPGYLIDDGISSAFFLLRQRPEIIAIACSGTDKNATSEATEPPLKRPRTITPTK